MPWQSKLAWLSGVSGGVLVFCAQTSREEAASNLSGYAKWLGMDQVPNWLAGQSIDSYATATGLILVATGLFLSLWNRRRKMGQVEKQGNGQIAVAPVLSARTTLKHSETRQQLCVQLKSHANIHTSVDILVWSGRDVPVAELLAAVFRAADWQTNYNATPQESFARRALNGTEIRGCNTHLVTAVHDALRGVGFSDIRKLVNPNNFTRNQPKYDSAENRVNIIIGHQD